MKQILLVVTMALFCTSAFAGLRYQDDQAYGQERWAEMDQDQQEAIYETQIQRYLDAIAARQQQQLNAIAARQQYIEELLQQNDDE
jgi:hypothetical protein